MNLLLLGDIFHYCDIPYHWFRRLLRNKTFHQGIVVPFGAPRSVCCHYSPIDGLTHIPGITLLANSISMIVKFFNKHRKEHKAKERAEREKAWQVSSKRSSAHTAGSSRNNFIT